VIEGIIEQSGTPYFCFKDLDENKPTGSIKIRVETIDYFLRRYREDIIARKEAEHSIEARLAEYERQLRSGTFNPKSEEAWHGSSRLVQIGAAPEEPYSQPTNAA
jgi:hypothetical protein